MSGSNDSTTGDFAATPAADTSAPADGGAAPSPAQTADNQAPATTPGEQTVSTPETPVTEREGLLAAVKKVLDPNAAKTPQQGEAAGTQTPGLANPTDPTKTAAQQAAELLAADPTADELKGMAPRTKARVEQLLSQRATLRTENESLKPNAAKWEQMNGYLTKHQLAPEDVNLLLGVGAALRRGDFKAFRDGVMPYVQMCNEALGEALPADIQAKVDAGEMSEEAGKQLSVTRFNNVRLQGQVKEATTRADSTVSAQQAAQVAAQVQTGIEGWEADIKRRDPDYALKASMVLRISQALIAEHGRPANVEQAVALATRAYDEANRTFAAVRPQPKPTAQAPSSARAVNGARAAPASLMEAAMRGLENSRATRQ